MPPIRLSRRNVKGRGWHKRGYRQNGCLSINIKEVSYGASHGFEVNENETLTQLVRQIESYQRAGDVFPRKEGWTFDIFFRRKSLVRLANENEARGDPPILVKQHFAGGETVYFKVYDTESNKRVFRGFGHWGYHDQTLDNRTQPQKPSTMSKRDWMIRQHVMALFAPSRGGSSYIDA